MIQTTAPAKKLKTILIGLSFLAAISVLGILTYVYINYESIIRNKLEESLPEAVSVDFGSLVVNPFNGTAQIENLIVLLAPGQTGRYHSLSIARVHAAGIGIMSFFTHDRLTLDSLSIEDGQVVLDHVLLRDTTDWNNSGRPGGGKLKRIEIRTLDIGRMGFLLKGDSVNECTFGTSMKFDRVAADLSGGQPGLKDIAYEIRELIFDSVLYAPQAGMYRYGAWRISYLDEQLAVDSFSVAAAYPQYEFAHRAGKQIDVFDLSIDSILITGFPLTGLTDSIIEATAIEVHGASLHIFRDRRMPFIKDHQEPLPVKVLQELPYAVSVGSIDIKDATIVYEEFPEEGNKSGTIVFGDVDAHFSGINNREDTFNSFINLDVNAMFMDSGLLKAKFAFPMNPGNKYYAEGTLDNFDLKNLNPTMEHLAMVRIESGKMHTMAFNFDYDNDIATGSVLLLYEDMEMTVLKEKESKAVANKVKTFFLNVLFAKRNKEDEVRLAKRNGTIDFERDKKRSIFNYWWKSLATGIKTSHSLN